MTQGPEDDEAERTVVHYEQRDDDDLLNEWERGEQVVVEPSGPMVSRSVRFSQQTMDRLREVADARGVGVTQLIREWTEERLRTRGDLSDRSLLADELERAARLLRESA